MYQSEKLLGISGYAGVGVGVGESVGGYWSEY